MIVVRSIIRRVGMTLHWCISFDFRQTETYRLHLPHVTWKTEGKYSLCVYCFERFWHQLYSAHYSIRVTCKTIVGNNRIIDYVVNKCLQLASPQNMSTDWKFCCKTARYYHCDNWQDVSFIASSPAFYVCIYVTANIRVSASRNYETCYHLF